MGTDCGVVRVDGGTVWGDAPEVENRVVWTSMLVYILGEGEEVRTLQPTSMNSMQSPHPLPQTYTEGVVKSVLTNPRRITTYLWMFFHP